MKVARLFGVALVAVLALCAMAASTALASSPEFKVLPLGPRFTSTSGVSTLKGANTAVTCLSDESTGVITSMDTIGQVVVRYHNCTITFGSCKTAIHSPGQPAGLIETRTIKGTLGTAKEAASGVGILFEPELAPTDKKFVTFSANECEPEATTTGGVIGEVTPVNSLSLTGKINLTAAGSTQGIAKITVLGKTVTPELNAFGSANTEASLDEVMWDGTAEIS